MKITEKHGDNELIIYENEVHKTTSKLFEFEKDKKYFIYFNFLKPSYSKDKPIIIQIFNESNNFKHNFKNGPLLLTGENIEYNFEIDISNYNIGEIIPFLFFGHTFDTFIYYRYKNCRSNYSIELGNFKRSNFIPIKITEKDSAIILTMKIYTNNNSDLLLPLDIFHYNYEEITSENNKEIKGPMLLKIDCNKYNNFNSIGIQSNQTFYLVEQIDGKQNLISNPNNFIMITYNYDRVYFKNVFIVFYTDDYSLLEIKKYNYPIYCIYEASQFYISLCHKNDNKNEIYLYSKENIITSVYGNFKINFTYSNDVHYFSDLNYNNTIQNNFEFNSLAYLKINCDSPAILTNINHNKINQKILKSGIKRYLSYEDIEKYKYTFDKTLVGEIIPLKLKVYGLDGNYSIKLILNETEYNLSNNIPLEINFNYQEYSEDLIYFIVDEDIKKFIIIEFIIGFLSNKLESFKQIDFNNNIGQINVKRNNGIFIKIPKEMDENLFDYWISFSKKSKVDVDISYDKIEYIAPRLSLILSNPNYHSIIPLFQINPYSMINEKSYNSDNKYFYICIYNSYSSDDIIFQIKKPKIVSNIEFNKLNILPEIKDNNYYYKINIPKSEYNSLLVQIINSNNSLNEIKTSISFDNIQIQKLFYNSYYYSIPINKLNPIINIYDTSNNNYINIVHKNEIINKEEKNYELNATIEKINNKNKIKIKMNSLSYYYSPLKNIYKYFLIINLEDDFISNISYISEVISGNKSLDYLKNQTMIIIEEETYNKNIFEKEIDINIPLNNYSNTMIVIPALKDYNLLEFNLMESYEFNYTNTNNQDENGKKEKGKNNDSKTIILICSICGGILLILIIIIIVYLKKKKKVSSDNIEKNDLNQDLNSLGEI